jgi:uncharacterized protein
MEDKMTTVPPTDVTSDDKLWSLLSYIFAPLVGLILLLMEDKKSRPFIKYHAVCSLVLGIVAVLFYVVLGWIIVGLCVGGLVWAYGVYVGIKAYNGEMINIPLVTDFVHKQGWA